MSFLKPFPSTRGINLENRSMGTLCDKCPWISLRLFLVVWRAYERERRSARLSKIAHRAPKFWGTRGNQPSKVQWRPKPGNTAFVITVVPVPCKYGNCALYDPFYTLANASVLWDFTRNHIILRQVFNFTQAANEHDCLALALHEKGVRMSNVDFVSVEEYPGHVRA